MSEEKLKPEDTALILIEYQNDFTTEKGKLHEAVKECMKKTKMIKNTQDLIAQCREKKVLIVYVPISFSEQYYELLGSYGVLAGIKKDKIFQKGTWGSEFCKDVEPKKGDVIVEGKKGLCGFYSTNLDFILRQNKIKNLLLTGFLTNVCVESTMRSAYERGYNVYTMKDCTAATSIEAMENAFKNDFGVFSIPTDSKEIMKKF